MPGVVASSRATIFTIGHSTRTIGELIRLLQAHAVGHLVDVRTIPRSRYNPQFNLEGLHRSLADAGIGYTHLKGLGGLRHPRADSPNIGWRNAGFRGYADYMQTPEFEQHLGALLQLVVAQRVAIMCAEAVPWRCHRSLIADALTARGIPVEHILTDAPAKPHALTPFAVVTDSRVTYPKPARTPRSHADNTSRASGLL